MFLLEDIVRVVNSREPTIKFDTVGKIIDGKMWFPKQWKQIANLYQNNSLNDVIFVSWNKINLESGMRDGAVWLPDVDFQLIGNINTVDLNLYDFSISLYNGFSDEEITKEIKLPELKEPRNNDGRKNCFWCNKETTIKLGLFEQYNYCELCKK
jgi:hypothetical protein